MKIYTRTGDSGETALFGGGRVAKHDLRVSAYGTVDELNATLGHALSVVGDPGVAGLLVPLQHDLFSIGAILATPPPAENRARPATPSAPTARIAEMEKCMDDADAELEPLREFILPGGTTGASALHLARTVCRRAEREVSRLAATDSVDLDVLRYLNRLSDLLFTLARLENERSGVRDVRWAPDAEPASG